MRRIFEGEDHAGPDRHVGGRHHDRLAGEADGVELIKQDVDEAPAANLEIGFGHATEPGGRATSENDDRCDPLAHNPSFFTSMTM